MNLINELRELAEDLYVNGYNRYSTAMSKAADELECLRAKLEAAEKETASWKGLAKQFGNEADALRAELSKQQALTDAAQHIDEVAQSRANKLQARITEMEQQEPIATIRINSITGSPSVDFIPGHRYLHHNSSLYALPGAKGE